jgi:hypothetical protein
MLFAALLAGALPGHAADWLVIGSGTTEVLMLDRDSVRRSGSVAEASTLHKHERDVAAAGEIPAHRSEISRLRFDCDAGTITVAERLFFSAAPGRQVGQVAAPAPAAVASSQREKMLLEMACGKK